MTDIAAKVAHVRAQVKKPHRPHRCHATGCQRGVPPACFMCPKHWRMVPRGMQRRIWDTYSLGQEDGLAEVSKEYLAAHENAVAAVASKEAR